MAKKATSKDAIKTSDTTKVSTKRSNSNLHDARETKNDEFYTQYQDIEREMNAYLEYNKDVFREKTILLPCDDPESSNFTKYFSQNFVKLGIKKLISTSYASNSKPKGVVSQPSELELKSKNFDPSKTSIKGKIFTLIGHHDNHGTTDITDLKWHYLEGDGDFRSQEIRTLRDEADIIITNPPFSLFREFLAWIIEAQKTFVIIGSINAISYKEVFPLIKDNQLWLGNGFQKGNAVFLTPSAKQYASGVYDSSTGLVKFRNITWFTNIDHGRRHQPLPLMSMSDNLRFSKHKDVKGKKSYDEYENYSAIEVPHTDAIPDDYKLPMGVPVSFIDKYCPEQFVIIGIDRALTEKITGKPSRFKINGVEKYARIVIQKKDNASGEQNESDT